MNKVMAVILGILLSFHAQAQVYDLVRTIKHSGTFTDDTATTINESFVSTGTLEVVGNTIIRNFHTCEFGQCSDITMNDEILGFHPSNKSVTIFGDSGELAGVTLISTNPTLIILQESIETSAFRIDEYKLRQ